MSSQPPNDSNVTAQGMSLGLRRLLVTNTQDGKSPSLDAPILLHKLFPEIMSLIFDIYVYPPGWEREWKIELFNQPWNLWNGPNDYPKGYFRSLVLASVCKHWRNIALSTPELWNKLFIVVNAKNSTTVDTKQRALFKVEHARLRLVRSNPLPLTLYVACYQSGSETTEGSLIKTIIECSSRWSHLFLRGNCDDLSQIWAAIPKYRPALPLKTLMVIPTCRPIDRRLRKNCHSPVFERPGMIASPTLGLFLGQMAVPDLKNFTSGVNWLYVTHLHLEILRARDCRRILKQAHQLLSLQVGCFNDIDEVKKTSPLVRHEKLKSFKMYRMHERVKYSEFVFFRTLIFPELIHLHLPFYSGSLTVKDRKSGLTRKLSFRNILETFICTSCCWLKRLDLIDFYSSERRLIDMLKEVPSLEDLHITVPHSALEHMSKVANPLLAFITTTLILPNLQTLSYLVSTYPAKQWDDVWNPETFDGKHPDFVKFIFAKLPRHPLPPLDKAQPITIAPSSRPYPLTSQSNKSYNFTEDHIGPVPPSFPSYNLLADKDLIDKETVLRFKGNVKEANITPGLAESPDSDDFFICCIELHKKYR